MSRVRKKTSQKAKDDRPSFRKYFRRYWQLYAMMALPFCWLLLFKYGPMLGNILAFRRFKPLTGPYGVSWAEPPLRYFRQFLGQKQFWQAFRNTLIISIMNLAVNFPVPIIFAILLNELRNLKIKSFVQTVSYIPRFISTAVVISILAELLSPSTGMINQVLNAVFHIPPVYYMNEPGYFRFLYILTDMWQYTGWTAIIYLAAIAGINKELFESARIDGASRFQQILYIMLPSIMPTIMVMFILSVGTLLSLGYEKVLLMQTPTNMVVSDIIDTYVYRLSLGAASPQYSLGSAVGLFNGVIGLILVSGLHLTGSVWAILLPFAINQFFLVILVNFFKSIPKELEEAAMIDGLGYFGILFRVVLPLSRPALATIGLYTAVFFWNNWFYPLIYLKADQYPVMLLLRNIVNGGTAITSDGGQSALAISIRSAVILVSTVPIVLLYPFLQKYFVGSIYLGAVKE